MKKYSVHIVLEEGKGFKFNSASVEFGVSTDGTIIVIDDEKAFELSQVEKLEIKQMKQLDQLH